MMYSEILKHPKISRALQQSFLDKIPSPYLDKGDFYMGGAEEALKDDSIIEQIVNNEISSRKLISDHQEKVIKYEAEIKKYESENKDRTEFEEKFNFILPYVERQISGHVQKPYQHLEGSIAKELAKEVVKKYSDRINVSDTPIQEKEDSLSPLDSLLKNASITYLDQNMSEEEIILRTLGNSEFSGLLN